MKLSDVQDQISRAAASRKSVVDYGKLHADFGDRPPADNTSIDLPSGIIEHFDRDLAVRVAAGTTMATLQDALRAKGQFVPIDLDDDMTLSEAVNCNIHGPLRLTYGSIRDLLLGLAYVDAEGEEVRVGGRTVKNVAGLDVTRFMVGSLGELGLVHELTVRTFAVPEHVLAVELSLEQPTQLDEILNQWLLTDALPVWMLMRRNTDRWRLDLAYHGRSVHCSAQVRSLEQLLTSAPGVHVVGTSDTTFESDQLHRANCRQWLRDVNTLVKIIVPVSATAAVMERIASFDLSHVGLEHLHIDALPAHGCIHVGSNMDAVAARELDARIAAATQRFHGVRQWIRQPESADRLAPVQPMPPNLPMLKRLKVALDPGGLFNPGRLIPVSEAATA